MKLIAYESIDRGIPGGLHLVACFRPSYSWGLIPVVVIKLVVPKVECATCCGDELIDVSGHISDHDDGKRFPDNKGAWELYFSCSLNDDFVCEGCSWLLVFGSHMNECK